MSGSQLKPDRADKDMTEHWWAIRQSQTGQRGREGTALADKKMKSDRAEEKGTAGHKKTAGDNRDKPLVANQSRTGWKRREDRALASHQIGPYNAKESEGRDSCAHSDRAEKKEQRARH